MTGLRLFFQLLKILENQKAMRDYINEMTQLLIATSEQEKESEEGQIQP